MTRPKSTNKRPSGPTAAQAGAALAHLGAAKGGAARAARLSPEDRSDSARKAAEARWGTTHVDATHAGVLVIGDRTIECAVLEDGTRVLSQGTILSALGRAPTMGRRNITQGRAPFLSAQNLRPFVTAELAAIETPMEYRMPNGARSIGYRAEILPMLCEVYLDANHENVILPNQRAATKAAEILIRGLARVGIIALVDEATGYQEVRARYELQAILEAYVRPEFRKWLKAFPDDFFREIYRLQNWEYRPGTSKRTPQVGKLIKHYIYEQLPAGVLAELERVNPTLPSGRRAKKHHQFLTNDTGNPHLDRQISTVTTLMRIARNRQDFEDLFERAFPPLNPRLPLVVEVPDQIASYPTVDRAESTPSSG